MTANLKLLIKDNTMGHGIIAIGIIVILIKCLISAYAKVREAEEALKISDKKYWKEFEDNCHSSRSASERYSKCVDDFTGEIHVLETRLKKFTSCNLNTKDY